MPVADLQRVQLSEQQAKMAIARLKKSSLNHPIWQNKLLASSLRGELSLSDYRLLFSQYYFYSKNFIRVLAAVMLKIETPRDNIKIIENLIEEAGNGDESESHYIIFEKFLSDALNINALGKLIKKQYTARFIQKYIDLCLSVSTPECIAILAFSTEGIVSNLYTILKKGLLLAGVAERNLHFFDLHIDCDDGHSEVFEEILQKYLISIDVEKTCFGTVHEALSLRDEFFSSIYDDIRAFRA